ncbi:Vacuolar protein sorting-associated protein 52 [Savitreella phatthalungensis]
MSANDLMDVLDSLLKPPRQLVTELELPDANLTTATDSELAVSHGTDGALHDPAILRLTELKQTISACDEILTKIQAELKTFQTELDNVTSDIDGLQGRSTAMAGRLQNRRALEAVLGPAVDEVVLPPELIRLISDAPVDKTWVAGLMQLDQFSKKSRTSTSKIDVEYPEELVEKLKQVAVRRIRDYVVSKIKQMRLPNANVGVIQQASFLRHRKIWPFLQDHHAVLAKEIAQAYTYTMRWYYQSSFDRYQKALSRMTVLSPSKGDLLGGGIADETSKSLGGMFSSSSATNKSSSGKTGSEETVAALLKLGTRARHLHDKTSGIILAHVAEDARGKPVNLERIFRSYVVALVDNAAVEYLFQNEFFRSRDSSNARQIADLFAQTIDATLRDAQNWVRQLTHESLDVIGLLICIRQCQKLSFDLQKRKVAGLEPFLDGLAITLWPRVQAVMDLHSASLRGSAISVSSVNEHARARKPLPLTVKFADLLNAILQLGRDTPGAADEPVARSLDRLRHDYESCMTRMAAACEPAARNAMLARNYAHVAAVIDACSGPLAELHKGSIQQVASSLSAAV